MEPRTAPRPRLRLLAVAGLLVALSACYLPPPHIPRAAVLTVTPTTVDTTTTQAIVAGQPPITFTITNSGNTATASPITVTKPDPIVIFVTDGDASPPRCGPDPLPKGGQCTLTVYLLVDGPAGGTPPAFPGGTLTFDGGAGVTATVTINPTI